MRVLTCEAGHEWEHPGGRGRPPKACPEHRSPASEQAAERHRSFYVPHPRGRAPKPSAPRLTDAERSEKARSAALARWSKASVEERVAAATRAARARFGGEPKVRPPVVERPCPYCGATMRGATRKQCGSPECRRRFNADRGRKSMHERRARLNGNEWEPFDPVEVYERDGWTCGICDLPVDRSLIWPDPASVSLDHIIPVSLDGPHTRANTRCSHLGCNSKRGNRAA